MVVLPLLILVGTCVVVWKARPWIRVVTAAVVFVILLIFGVLDAMLICGLHANSCGRWIKAYSSHLRALSEKGDVNELQTSVRKFDEAVQRDPNSLVNLRAAVSNVLPREEYLRLTD